MRLAAETSETTRYVTITPSTPAVLVIGDSSSFERCSVPPRIYTHRTRPTASGPGFLVNISTRATYVVQSRIPNRTDGYPEGNRDPARLPDFYIATWHRAFDRPADGPDIRDSPKCCNVRQTW